MISRKKFEFILEYRKNLKHEIEDLVTLLKCKHKIGEAVGGLGGPTIVHCVHCNQSYYTAHTDDNGTMTKEHLREYNNRKKNKKETKVFSDNINKRIREQIKDIKKAYNDMFIIDYRKPWKFTWKRRLKILYYNGIDRSTYINLLDKPRLRILTFKENHSHKGTRVDIYGMEMFLIQPKTFHGYHCIFSDDNILINQHNGNLEDPDEDELWI